MNCVPEHGLHVPQEVTTLKGKLQMALTESTETLAAYVPRPCAPVPPSHWPLAVSPGGQACISARSGWYFVRLGDHVIKLYIYRGRLFSNAVAKIMEIFSNRQEAAFSDVLRIIIR